MEHYYNSQLHTFYELRFARFEIWEGMHAYGPLWLAKMSGVGDWGFIFQQLYKASAVSRLVLCKEPMQWELCGVTE